MKIAFFSDIHVEFENQRKIELPEHVDVLIVAGDVHTKGRGLQWVYETYQNDADVIIVTYGNHDFWGGRYQKIIAEAREFAASIPNLHFLENSAVCINGVHFVGGTLWTDYKLGPNPQPLNMIIGNDVMNDSRRITFNPRPGTYRKMLASDMLALNQETKRYIFEYCATFKNEPLIVVTHHGPTFKSLDPLYAGSSNNPCYVSVFDNELANGEGPDVWLHGHVHNDCDYRVGRTRVLCNPIGYPGQIPGAQPRILELS